MLQFSIILSCRQQYYVLLKIFVHVVQQVTSSGNDFCDCCIQTNANFEFSCTPIIINKVFHFLSHHP
jgi:hypothetical protein